MAPEIVETRFINNENILLGILVALLGVFSFPLILTIFSLSLVGALVLLLIYVVAFSIFLFFLLQPTVLRETRQLAIRTVERPVIQYVTKPVIQEKYIEKPVIKEIIVEKPVYRDIVRPVYASYKEKLDIPKYTYLGSSETKTFHKRNCRFSKLIKKKYKISNNNKSYFTNRNFKQCKICFN